ncbi:MAG TPA: lamin tail domain-containing protein [Thermoanaerobaculia bacterium]|nr:lamin tail domain-containing protein [Thermoanaerobaculia bacterium]
MRRTLLRGAILAATFWISITAAGLGQPTELFFSEYIEGSSNNKALEIYNGTGSAVLLTGTYSVQMFFNGNATAGLTINLTGTVAAGDVFVLAQSAANAAILAQADQTNGAGWFNGDDAVVLRKGTTIVDSIGQVGFDPGTEWGTGVQSTADNTLRRKSSICAGDTTATDVFDPSIQWDGFATDVATGLGAHVAICGNGPTGVGSAQPSVVDPGESTLLTVSVTPGSSPTSTGITVTGDLTSIGGSATQTFYDDGLTGGDVSSGDSVFSYSATVAPATTGGNKSLPTTINDAQGRTGSAPITLGVRAVLEIFQIQGTGLASPYVGAPVSTRDNVVTGVGPNGFFIQTPAARADADVETSNGVFVFTGSVPTVSVGDQVDVKATVAEFFNLTELSSPTVSTDSTGNPLPAVVMLDSTTPSPNQPQPANEMERFEGMLVRVENALVTGPTDQFGDFSIASVSGRTFREPGILYPGLPGLPIWDGNPEVYEINPNQLGLPAADVPAGAVVTLAEGPLSFDFGDYQIWPTTLNVTGVAQVVPVRDRNAGEFLVGTQNVLRLFDLVDDPTKSDETPTAPVYAGRLNKLSLLIRDALKSPDVLTVQEAENLTVLQDLAAKIAADDPSVVYTPYLLEGHDIGGIDIGFLVRDTVQVDSVEQVGYDTELSLDGSKLNDRPPLVLRGSYVGGTVPFPIVVIGVHQRSLSGIEGTSASANRVRVKRHEQAQELSEYIQTLQTADADIRLTVAGDFNAFEFTDGYVDVMGQVTGNPDPAGALIPATDEVNPNLTNQTLNLPAGERYSFVFEGNAQSLDHAITSTVMDFWLRGVQHVRGNSDAPASFEVDSSTALRSSDHDGTVLFVMGDNDGDGFPDDADSCVASDTSATVVIDGCDSGAGNDLFSNGCKISDTIAACAAAAATHEDFTGCVAHATNELLQSGVITAKERGAIQKCAGKADIP